MTEVGATVGEPRVPPRGREEKMLYVSFLKPFLNEPGINAEHHIIEGSFLE
jgi:hypothetical protein